MQDGDKRIFWIDYFLKHFENIEDHLCLGFGLETVYLGHEHVSTDPYFNPFMMINAKSLGINSKITEFLKQNLIAFQAFLQHFQPLMKG